MAHYKDFVKKCLGSSDIAALTIRSPKGVFDLQFGSDGDYFAYVVEGEAHIGEHYELVFEDESWLSVYDDEVRTFKFKGKNKDIQGGYIGLYCTNNPIK